MSNLTIAVPCGTMGTMTMSQPLPLTRQEMLDCGWDSVDVVFVTGDAYKNFPILPMRIK